MDYEKLYKDAFDRAKKLHKDAITLQLEQDIKDYEYIFPELAESEDERIRKALVRFHKSSIDIDGIKGEDIIAWLEKQSNQKLIIDGILTATNYDKMFQNCKVHKFNSGDWIVFNGLILHIDEFVNGYYRTTTIGGIPNSYDWNIDNAARLWTIQDAKDGDVLATKSGKPFIFKGLLDKFHTESPVAYCGIATTDDFFLSTGGGRWTCEEVYPATKEQCDLLFSKMREFGYEWDAEKKELSKLVIDEGKAEMDYCFTKMMNGEKVSPIWSEEDENFMYDTLTNLIHLKDNGGGYCNVGKCIDWLKSIKDRVQPKQEWSEEDEKMCQETIDWFEKKCFPYALESENPARESINWLKSLKERIK